MQARQSLAGAKSTKWHRRSHHVIAPKLPRKLYFAIDAKAVNQKGCSRAKLPFSGSPLHGMFMLVHGKIEKFRVQLKRLRVVSVAFRGLRVTTLQIAPDSE